MKRPMSLVAIVVASLVQGCAVSPRPSALMANSSEAADSIVGATTNPVSPVALCATPEGCARPAQAIAGGAEIGIEKDAPLVEGHPLTSVVVTQCNLVVAVYMTMPDGRFLRFDRKANVPAEQLVATAYTATRSERVEVSCDGVGVAGYETHDPV